MEQTAGKRLENLKKERANRSKGTREYQNKEQPARKGLEIENKEQTARKDRVCYKTGSNIIIIGYDYHDILVLAESKKLQPAVPPSPCPPTCPPDILPLLLLLLLRLS